MTIAITFELISFLEAVRKALSLNYQFTAKLAQNNISTELLIRGTFCGINLSGKLVKHLDNSGLKSKDIELTDMGL